MRIAVLANTNFDFVVRNLKIRYNVYSNEGYANDIGALVDKESSFYQYNPDIVFMIEDVWEIIRQNNLIELDLVEKWFSMFESAIDKKKRYYVSDCVMINLESRVLSEYELIEIGMKWNTLLLESCNKYSNIHIFPYARTISQKGINNIYSAKMWYMGRIQLNMDAQRCISDAISCIVENNVGKAKKVLVLDLDNTIWGGLAGENDNNPIELSDEHNGLIYKDCQRIIKKIQQSGAVLAIASKNNYNDAIDIIKNNPHMVLRMDDFVALKINWNDKTQSIIEIAKELNLGLDSFVFWDDSIFERERVKEVLPEVYVPDFPKKVELIPEYLVKIYKECFEKTIYTREDLERTEQYRSNARREQLEKDSISYEMFLKNLNIVLTEVDSVRNKDRVLQLINKTNQFNLTTYRLEEKEYLNYCNNDSYLVCAYDVRDCYGDSGITAVVIVEIVAETARIIEFTMSCRIMGRRIENAVLDHIEKKLINKGIKYVEGIYNPTEKNIPVKDFYSKLGYSNGEKLGVYKKELTTESDYLYYALIEEEL